MGFLGAVGQEWRVFKPRWTTFARFCFGTMPVVQCMDWKDPRASRERLLQEPCTDAGVGPGSGETEESMMDGFMGCKRGKGPE